MHSLYLLQRKFPGSHNPGCSLLFQKLHSLRSCYRHLCTGMKVKTGKHFTDRCESSHILHDHRIQSLSVIRKQVLIQLFRQFSVLKQCVYCKIKFLPINMGSINRAKQFLFLKILRIGPGAECRSSHIHRICSCSQSCLKPLVGARRCQKFNVFLSQLHTSCKIAKGKSPK